MIMTIANASALPSGPLIFASLAVKRVCGSWVEAQTGHPSAILAALYLRDRGRLETKAPHSISSAIAPDREDRVGEVLRRIGPAGTTIFPWEDHRRGHARSCSRKC